MSGPSASGSAQRRSAVVSMGGVGWWLTLLVLCWIALSLSGVLSPDSAYAQSAEPSDQPEPCPDTNAYCGDPSFPPPPATDPTGPEPVSAPVPPTSSGVGNPLSHLQLDPGFEFGYDQQNYDLWLARCGGSITEMVEDGPPGGIGSPGSVGSVPQVVWELYGEAERACPDKRRAATTVLGEAIGGDEIGRGSIPTGNYDIGYDQGAWNNVSRRGWGLVTDGLFMFTKWMTAATINLLEWAFGFDFASRLSGPANAIATGYYVSLNGSSVSIYDLALFATMFYFALQLLRGRTTAAIGELATTYVVYVVFVSFVVLVPGGFGRLIGDTTELSGKLASSIAAIGLDGYTNTAECPSAADPDAALGDVVCPFGKGLHTAFVERPYDMLSWGTDLGSGGEDTNLLQRCAARRDEILLTGPHGASDGPRFMMGTAGCEELADFNHDPTAGRAGLALFVAATSILVLVLAALSALTLIAAQLLLVGLIVVMPFVVVAGLMPGSGRALLWKWVAGVAKTVLAVVAIAVFLSLYLVTLLVMLEQTVGEPWLVQGGSMILVTLTMFWVRSRLLAASKRAATNAGERLSQARIGGNHSGGFFGAASAGFAHGGGDHARHHTRSGLARGRRFTNNASEWNTNRATRRSVRVHNRSIDRAAAAGANPDRLVGHRMAPPRGITQSGRARSGARMARRHRRATARRTNTEARQRVKRALAGTSRRTAGG